MEKSNKLTRPNKTEWWRIALRVLSVLFVFSATMETANLALAETSFQVIEVQSAMITSLLAAIWFWIVSK